MKKVFITGACGFIGSHLVQYFLKKKIKVVAYDLYNSNNNWGWLENNKNEKNLKVLLGNISDFKSVETSAKSCDTIIHLASLIGIPYSYNAPSSYISTNIIGTYNILEAAIKLKIKNVLVTSTSEVYGEQKYLPIDEKHPVEASSPYASTKIAADNLALSYFKSFKLPVKIVRPFNVFGPRQSSRGLIPNVILQILNNNKDIKVGNLYPKRDYTYVEDTCEAIYKVAKLSKKFNGEVFNIGTNKTYSVKEIIDLIKKLTKSNKKTQINSIRVRPKKSEVDILRCNNSKIRKHCNWKNKHSFKKGLEKTIIWLQENKDKFKSKIYNI